MRIWCCLVLSLLAPSPSSVVVAQGSTPANQDATRPSFGDFLAGVREEALARGIREDVVDLALSTVEAPLPIVLERDRAQAETVLSLDYYLSRRVTPKMAKRAREALTQHRALVEQVALRYGVPPDIIIAVWGMESNFGRFSGVRPTVAALATLAWDPRRSAFFRSELLAALEILNDGDIEVARMRGSWAGAMGQVQFMPSSYLKFAEDFDGDGRRDIWSSPADVFASIANYLQAHGWTAGQRWGREVRMSQDAEQRVAQTVVRRQDSCRAKGDMTIPQTMTEWQELGVRLLNGSELPTDAQQAALVSGSGRHFLVSASYDALLDYNCSHAYAVSVGLLSDRLASSPEQARHGKSREPLAHRRARR